MDLFLTYAARGKNAWWRYLLTGVVVVFGVLVVSVGCAVGLVLAGVPQNVLMSELEALLRPSTPLNLVYSVLLNFGPLFVIFLAVARLIQGKRPRDLVGSWSWKAFYAGLAIWGAFVVIGGVVDYLLDPASFRFSATDQTLVLAACALAVLPFQTFTEELLFRGWLSQGLLLATKRPWVTSVIAGCLFGSLHILNSSFSAAAAAIFGIVSTRIAIRLGGLAFTFGVHLANNLFGSVIVVSSTDVFRGSPALFTQTAPELGWSDVGIEAASLGVLLVLVLGPLGNRLAPVDVKKSS